MSAPPFNQNASKPSTAEKADSHLHIRCRTSDKAAWVHAVKGRKLADWVVEILNRRAAGLNKSQKILR